MRILVTEPGPAFSVHDVYVGLAEALTELGQQVYSYNLGARLTLYETALQEVDKLPDGTLKLRKALTRDGAIKLATNGLLSACYQTWPDIIVIVSGFFYDTDLLDLVRSRRHRLVLVCTEQPYELDRELALAAHVDLALLNDPTNLEAFRAVTAAEYLPHAYRPAVHHPGPVAAPYRSDFAFVGTGFASRIAFFEAMDLAGLDVVLAGNWQGLDDASPLRRHLAHDTDECLDNAQTADVYRGAKASLNLYRREADTPEAAQGWAIGPREVELAATGCFFLRDSRPEGDALFPTLPTFTDAEQASRQLRWWLDHDRERERAAAKAREAIAPRTFTNNARRLLELLDRQPAIT